MEAKQGFLRLHRRPRAQAAEGSPLQDVTSALAVFRFLAVVVVVTLTVVIQSRESQQTSLVIIATLATALSLIVVGFGLRLAAVPRLTYPLLAIDTGLAVAGILAGGGLDSPFLLYALLPVLTAAFLLNRVFAALLALIPGVTVVLAHTVLNRPYDRFVWILEGNYLTLVPVYALVGLAVAFLPFYANLNVRLGERERVRRAEQRVLRAELHDKLAQSLSALTLGLRQLDRVGGTSGSSVGELVHVSERSYAELRELLDLLEAGSWQPTAVGTLGRLVDSWEEESGISVIADLSETDLELPPEVSLALLGIAREALTNIGRHSSARQVWVTLTRTADGAVLSVRDNGQGFSDVTAPGHGRRIMQERADAIGASLVINSEPGVGTEVRVRYPAA